ncbi:anti-sigma factor [Erythrobacter sp. THAF29]|uniref:anti-sigma factor family protein n=1 Tax=Erythrobacter sp. THAF29 TaxID=2587851 RepID=UPI001267E7DE|nr:hypothetical protein [Erythrobacter sp. THAF29]QFT76861.1 hypothetical protein FIU90_04845 [Erythrobacter sp. THAF29]
MSGDNERDLRIAAFLDGAMSDAERAAFEREIERDEKLAEEVARLADNDALLREALAIPSAETVDEAFLEKMGLADGASGQTSATGNAANDNPPFWKRKGFGAGAAIAASLALVMAFALQGGGASPIGDALEASPSGTIVALGDGAELTPVLTFEAADGRFCREFAYSASGETSSGIACRGPSGWSIEAWSDEAVEIPDGSEIVLAEGGGAENLDSAYARLDAGDPITLEREHEIIASGWSSE